MRGPYSARPVPDLNPAQAAAYWSKVTRTPGCWVWTGATTGHPTHPYGRFRIGSGHYVAHRVSWALHYGNVPHGVVIDHLCKVTRCVRPDHMRAVTQQVNVASGDRWAS